MQFSMFAEETQLERLTKLGGFSWKVENHRLWSIPTATWKCVAQRTEKQCRQTAIWCGDDVQNTCSSATVSFVWRSDRVPNNRQNEFSAFYRSVARRTCAGCKDDLVVPWYIDAKRCNSRAVCPVQTKRGVYGITIPSCGKYPDFRGWFLPIWQENSIFGSRLWILLFKKHKNR